VSDVAAGMCAGYMFLIRTKKLPKYVKRFWTRRLFNQLGFFGEDPVLLDAKFFVLFPKLTFEIDDFFNFNSADFVFFYKKINHITFFIEVFVVGTVRISQTCTGL
jgi:hypothetical protein